MEADHAVAPHCCYEFQNKNGKVFSAPVHNWKKRGEIFNTWSWDKKKNASGQATNKDDTTKTLLMERYEEYCRPKKLVIDRRKFFTRNQLPDEPINVFITELTNLSSSCEFQDIKDGLIILHKLVDGIQSNGFRETLLRKGKNLTLKKVMEISRVDKVSKKELKLLHHHKEIEKM